MASAAESVEDVRCGCKLMLETGDSGADASDIRWNAALDMCGFKAWGDNVVMYVCLLVMDDEGEETASVTTSGHRNGNQPWARAEQRALALI